MKYKAVTLTSSKGGHTLHHNNVFSADGKWVVFDGRNDDTKIAETTWIGCVNIETGEEKVLYKTENPNSLGPGVGAASVNIHTDDVIFIHGLNHQAYSMTSRTGIGFNLKSNEFVFNYDARDVSNPYNPGSLRGGTHSHAWSSDGNYISFTYNDAFVEPELRTVGVMFEKEVSVENIEGNISGKMYSVVVANVVLNPKKGSNEINKAFDECWLGNKNTIVFQGNVLNENGEEITEVFSVEIDKDLILKDESAIGKEGQRPQVPKGIVQKRITHSAKGLSKKRHWLRSDNEGDFVFALAKDQNNVDQIVQICAKTGKMSFLTHLDFGVDFTFNIFQNEIVFVSSNEIQIIDISSRKIVFVSKEGHLGKIVGAPLFSLDGETIVFNQYLKDENEDDFLQIRKIKR